jgi:hypothetical protein
MDGLGNVKRKNFFTGTPTSDSTLGELYIASVGGHIVRRRESPEVTNMAAAEPGTPMEAMGLPNPGSSTFWAGSAACTALTPRTTNRVGGRPINGDLHEIYAKVTVSPAEDFCQALKKCLSKGRIWSILTGNTALSGRPVRRTAGLWDLTL